MYSFYHVFRHFKQNGLKQRPLFLFSLILFSWTVFDGIISYIAPILITSRGISNTAMGMIIGFSSLAGAVFDFLLSKFLRNTDYRRLYFYPFLLCLLFPLVLWQAKTIWVFLAAMTLWGLYYDLYNFANFDFVGRHSAPTEHSSCFGILEVFKSLGYFIGPIIAGLT